MNFLIAALLAYTFEAGITAAAGTRLALHWLIDKIFIFYLNTII